MTKIAVPDFKISDCALSLSLCLNLDNDILFIILILNCLYRVRDSISNLVQGPIKFTPCVNCKGIVMTEY